jgi:hypothetical protein
MNTEAIKKLLGLPPEATDDQVMTAIKAGAQAVEDLAAERTKAEAAEADKAKADGDLANACKERDEAKTALENCKKDLEEAKTALANEKAQHEKTRELKTKSAVGRLELSNEARDKSAARLALVNEKQKAGMKYFDAWQAAKAEKPELFEE